MKRIESFIIRGLLYVLLGVMALGAVACQRSALAGLDKYGNTVKEIDLVVSPDGTKDFWRLTQKDNKYYWIHITDGPGSDDRVAAYGAGTEPHEEPPRHFDKALRGFGDKRVGKGPDECRDLPRLQPWLLKIIKNAGKNPDYLSNRNDFSDF